MNAIGDLKHTLIDAAREGDLLGHIDESLWADTRLDKLDGPPPIETLTKRQRQILDLAQKSHHITNADVREALPYWHCETIRVDPARLVNLGFLEKLGTKRGTHCVAAGVR